MHVGPGIRELWSSARLICTQLNARMRISYDRLDVDVVWSCVSVALSAHTGRTCPHLCQRRTIVLRIAAGHILSEVVHFEDHDTLTVS